MKKLLLSVIVVAMAITVSAQKLDAPRIALKSNVLSLSLGSINLGSEVRIAPKWTLASDVTLSVTNFWGGTSHAEEIVLDEDLKGFYANGWSGFVEARYYFKQALHGHHLGFYAMGGRYGRADVSGDLWSIILTGGLKDSGTDAYVTSAGLSYGYFFKFGEKGRNYWGLDLYIGGGIFYANPVLNNLASNIELDINGHFNWSLMKTGVALSYTF